MKTKIGSAIIGAVNGLIISALMVVCLFVVVVFKNLIQGVLG